MKGNYQLRTEERPLEQQKYFANFSILLSGSAVYFQMTKTDVIQRDISVNLAQSCCAIQNLPLYDL